MGKGKDKDKDKGAFCLTLACFHSGNSLFSVKN